MSLVKKNQLLRANLVSEATRRGMPISPGRLATMGQTTKSMVDYNQDVAIAQLRAELVRVKQKQASAVPGQFSGAAVIPIRVTLQPGGSAMTWSWTKGSGAVVVSDPSIVNSGNIDFSGGADDVTVVFPFDCDVEGLSIRSLMKDTDARNCSQARFNLVNVMDNSIIGPDLFAPPSGNGMSEDYEFPATHLVANTGFTFSIEWTTAPAGTVSGSTTPPTPVGIWVVELKLAQ